MVGHRFCCFPGGTHRVFPFFVQKTGSVRALASSCMDCLKVSKMLEGIGQSPTRLNGFFLRGEMDRGRGGEVGTAWERESAFRSE